MQKNLGKLVRLLASPKLTIVLVLVWAAAFAGAMYLEATKGGEWADWYVHTRGWYRVLLGLLIAHIAAVTLRTAPGVGVIPGSRLCRSACWSCWPASCRRRCRKSKAN